MQDDDAESDGDWLLVCVAVGVADCPTDLLCVGVIEDVNDTVGDWLGDIEFVAAWVTVCVRLGPITVAWSTRNV